MRLSTTAVRAAAATAAMAGMLATVAVGGGQAGADGTAPPWAPGGVSPDAFAVGGLTFYDAAGNVITSGSTSTAPFAAYVQGRVAPRPLEADTKASLLGYVPQEGVTPDTWSHDEALGVGTTYPNGGAPGALSSSTLPLNAGSAGDSSLDTFASDFPPTSSTAGYAGVYEIRLYTTHPGGPPASYYDYADISIDSGSHTWSLVFTPGASGPEDSALTITGPSSVKYGAKAPLGTKLTDTVSTGAISGATVKLYERASSSKPWKAVSTRTTSASGRASAAIKLTANERFEWRYAGEASHAATTSAVRSVTATQVVDAKRTPASVKHGKHAQIYGTVTPPGSGDKVTLQQRKGHTWTSIGKATIKKQKLPNGHTATGFVFTVTPAKKGTYTYRAYKPATSSLGAGYSAAVTVKAT